MNQEVNPEAYSLANIELTTKTDNVINKALSGCATTTENTQETSTNINITKVEDDGENILVDIDGSYNNIKTDPSIISFNTSLEFNLMLPRLWHCALTVIVVSLQLVSKATNSPATKPLRKIYYNLCFNYNFKSLYKPLWQNV